MRVAILGNWKKDELREVMLDVVNEFPLFCVVCGGNDEKSYRSSAGYKWAIENGAPVEFLKMEGKTEDQVIEKLVWTIDYAIIAYDGENALLRKLIMKMKNSGKHGKVIKYDK
ncbi:MAG: hypothetical protein [Caudoviricetes sp.]|nr:MAG: hypothetical protein [Caudoviricetes sp.]